MPCVVPAGTTKLRCTVPSDATVTVPTGTPTAFWRARTNVALHVVPAGCFESKSMTTVSPGPACSGSAFTTLSLRVKVAVVVVVVLDGVVLVVDVGGGYTCAN